jgi:hypothetical protein
MIVVKVSAMVEKKMMMMMSINDRSRINLAVIVGVESLKVESYRRKVWYQVSYMGKSRQITDKKHNISS